LFFSVLDTSLWDYLEKNLNGGMKIELKTSIFIGDAAGRPKNWDSKGIRKGFLVPFVFVF
jgi:hypothetical protein